MLTRRAWYRIATVAWMGLIFYLSSIPDLKSSLPSIVDLILRKCAHVIEYGVLFILARGSFERSERNSLALVLAIAYAISDELHQAVVPGRGPSLIDVFIDAAGVISGFLLIRKRPPPQA